MVISIHFCVLLRFLILFSICLGFFFAIFVDIYGKRISIAFRKGCERISNTFCIGYCYYVLFAIKYPDASPKILFIIIVFISRCHDFSMLESILLINGENILNKLYPYVGDKFLPFLPGNNPTPPGGGNGLLSLVPPISAETRLNTIIHKIQ